MSPTTNANYYKTWRRRQSTAWRREQNRKSLAYQKTEKGYLAQKSGLINTAAKNRGATGKLNSRQLARLDKICGHPECELPGDEYDHLVPIGDGGSNTIDNIWMLCKAHHHEKSANEKSRRAYGDQALEWIPGAVKIVVPQMDFFAELKNGKWKQLALFPEDDL